MQGSVKILKYKVHITTKLIQWLLYRIKGGKIVKNVPDPKTTEVRSKMLNVTQVNECDIYITNYREAELLKLLSSYVFEDFKKRSNAEHYYLRNNIFGFSRVSLYFHSSFSQNASPFERR